MKRIVRYALTGAIKSLIGSDWWDQVRDVVLKLGSENIPGEEKRAMAITFLKESGWKAASWLLNLAIEIAVTVLSEELEHLEEQPNKSKSTA